MEEEKQRIIASIEGPLTEIVEDKHYLGRIKEKIVERMQDWGEGNVVFGEKVRKEIQKVK